MADAPQADPVEEMMAKADLRDDMDFDQARARLLEVGCPPDAAEHWARVHCAGDDHAPPGGWSE